MCYSVWQWVALCCIALQCIAVWCGVLQCVAVCGAVCCSELVSGECLCVSSTETGMCVYYTVLRSVLHCVAVYGSVI